MDALACEQMLGMNWGWRMDERTDEKGNVGGSGMVGLMAYRRSGTSPPRSADCARAQRAGASIVGLALLGNRTRLGAQVSGLQ